SYWSLRFGAFLVFGAWCLVFSFISQRLHRIDLRRATAGSLRQGRRDSPGPTNASGIRAAGLFVARVGQRNCIDAGLLSGDSAADVPSHRRIATQCDTDCSGRDDSEARTQAARRWDLTVPQMGRELAEKRRNSFRADPESQP